MCETPSWVHEALRAHRNQLLIEIELNSTSKTMAQRGQFFNPIL